MVDVARTAAALNVPDRKAACPAQACVFREKAEADPANRERWVVEAIKCLERAVASDGQAVVIIDEVHGLSEESGWHVFLCRIISRLAQSRSARAGRLP